MKIQMYLDDLEQRIDDAQECQLEQQWEDFVSHKYKTGCFLPERKIKKSSSISWPDLNINDAIADYETMALAQLKMCSDLLASGSGELLNIRANYGTGIIPTMFGASLFIMPYETNTLPCTRPLERNEHTISNLLKKGIPDLYSGLGKRVFEFAAYYKDLIKNYPMIQKHVHVYAPDFQGPLAITEMLLGSNMYLDLYDAPEEIENIMQLMTDTFIQMQKKWHTIFPPYSDHMSIDWGMLHGGCVLIRNDAAMNISGNCYENFVQPFDQQIFDAFGGGAIHFCGRGDHYIEKLSHLKGISAINMSQPEYNDMNTIYQNTIDKGIQIFGLNPSECMRAMKSGIDLKGNIYSGISLSAWNTLFDTN